MTQRLMLITEKGVVEFIPKSTLEEFQQKVENERSDSATAEGPGAALHDSKKLYTFPEVQEIFDCSRPTLYNWIEQGILHPVRIGGRIYFDPLAIDELIRERSKRE